MGLGKSLKKLKKIVDPIGTRAEKATNKALGLSGKKTPSKQVPASSPSSRGSGGGTGPQTQDVGRPQRATLNGGDAMVQSRNLTAGARSGVGRLQKAGIKVR